MSIMMSIMLWLYGHPWFLFLLMEIPFFFVLFLNLLFYIFFIHRTIWSKYIVNVYEKRADTSFRVRKVYGKEFIDTDGMKKLRLSWYHINLPLPELSNLIPINNRQDVYNVVRDKGGNFHAITPEGLNEVVKFRVQDMDVIGWTARERKLMHERLLKREEHWIKTYWPQIGLIVLFVGAVFFFIMGAHYSSGLLEKSSAQSAALTNKILDISNKYARIFLFAMGEDVPDFTLDDTGAINQTANKGTPPSMWGLVPT